MTGTDLTAKQAQRLRLAIARRLQYLNHLCGRMQRLGFVPDDPLFIAGERARMAMQDLHVAAHYAGCKHGVGRTSDV